VPTLYVINGGQIHYVNQVGVFSPPPKFLTYMNCTIL